jgi:two-component system response regulator PilR (NtrC family)
VSTGLRVLVVDDEEVIRDVLERLLEREGWTVNTAENAAEALEVFDSDPHDVVLLDLMLPDRPGLEVLREMRRRDADAVIVIVTAYSSIEGAIQAMREGAFHYIPKPFQNQEVLLTVRKGAEARRLTEENRRLKQELSRQYGLGRIIGKSEAMRKVFDLVRLAGPSRSTILVEGESGTGKELVARAIHTHSPRAGAPFVTVNSGSMPTDLLESNLFGHIRGAFTGAVANKKGLFEAAEGGSIFFDEIGTISLETQAKLLRLIQEKEFMKVGSVETLKADVRIIAATNVDLKKMVTEGRFRDDLYYRLCVITVSIPPLRERREDIPLLAEHFMRLYANENGRRSRGSRPKRCARFSTTIGPATSGSSRTRSSGRSSSARAGRSASSCCRTTSSPPRGRMSPCGSRRTARPTRRWSRSTSAAWCGRPFAARAGCRSGPRTSSASSPRPCTKSSSGSRFESPKPSSPTRRSCGREAGEPRHAPLRRRA